MRNADLHLTDGERVLYRAELTPMIFSGPAVFLALAAYVFARAVGDISYATSFSPRSDVFTLAWALFMPVLVWGGVAYIRFANTEYVITTERVILKTRLLGYKARALLLSKVETVATSQWRLQEILGYGVVAVTATGGARLQFPWVRSPLKFRQRIEYAASAARELSRAAGPEGVDRTSGGRPEVADLERLADLFTSGALSEEEFESAKKRLLG